MYGVPDCPAAGFEVRVKLVIMVVGPGATANGVVVPLLLAGAPFFAPDVMAGRALDKTGVRSKRVPLWLVAVAPGMMVLSEILWSSSVDVGEASDESFEELSDCDLLAL